LNQDFLCSEVVIRDMGHRVSSRDLGEIAVKGKEKPLRLFALDWEAGVYSDG